MSGILSFKQSSVFLGSKSHLFTSSIRGYTTDGSSPDMEMMLKEYYQYRGWDWETGKPTKEKLMELGLTQVAEELYE